jgi:hypothetical protein
MVQTTEMHFFHLWRLEVHDQSASMDGFLVKTLPEYVLTGPSVMEKKRETGREGERERERQRKREILYLFLFW